MRRAGILGAVWLILGLWTSPLRAEPTPAVPVDVPLTSTFVTEGVLPATEIEGGFSFTKSEANRTYQLGLTSLQYAWGPLLGLKLSVPVTLIEPRSGDAPTVAGPGDISVLAKSAPVVSMEHLFALGGGVMLTVPTGSESRGLGGMWAVAPGLMAGKAWRLGERVAVLQADAFYSWQLDEPDDGEQDREQRFSANLTTGLTLSSFLTAIVEVNSVRVVAGDPTLRHHWQLYLTPGLSVQPADRWDIRAGVQLPLTHTREFDYSVILLVTKGF